MDKEEILRRSREEGQDEWEEKVNDTLTRRENTWISPLIIVASIFFAGHGYAESWVPYALIGLICIPSVIFKIYGYVKVRKTQYLVIAGLGIFAILLSLNSIYDIIYG